MAWVGLLACDLDSRKDHEISLPAGIEAHSGRPARPAGAIEGEETSLVEKYAPAGSRPPGSGAKIYNPKLLDPENANAVAPEKFRIVFETTKGKFIVAIDRSLSPLGADRLYNLVQLGYFEHAAFFRAIGGFMVQFGIHGAPAVSKVWRDAKIADEPVKASNTRGMLTYAMAGPNTRTTQLFINYGNNARLDGMGFAPLGEVVEGMEIVDSLYQGYGEGAPRGAGPSQGRMQAEGNRYLLESFPKLDYIVEAWVEGNVEHPADIARAEGKTHSPELLDLEQAKATAPETYAVRFETTQGDFEVEVERAWAPNGADRLYNLVQLGYFDDVAFFRVIPRFMAQFGIHGHKEVNDVWREARIPDDPVTQSNTRGMVSFATAGPNSRTTQLFINFKNNANLDGMGFAPLGKVDDEGMKVVDALFQGYGEGAPRGRGPNQGLMQMHGNAYLKDKFPKLDYIKRARIVVR